MLTDALNTAAGRSLSPSLRMTKDYYAARGLAAISARNAPTSFDHRPIWEDRGVKPLPDVAKQVLTRRDECGLGCEPALAVAVIPPVVAIDDPLHERSSLPPPLARALCESHGREQGIASGGRTFYTGNAQRWRAEPKTSSPR
jgi:hypothetical protein